MAFQPGKTRAVRSAARILMAEILRVKWGSGMRMPPGPRELVYAQGTDRADIPVAGSRMKNAIKRSGLDPDSRISKRGHAFAEALTEVQRAKSEQGWSTALPRVEQTFCQLYGWKGWAVLRKLKRAAARDTA
jgi:hypothetical protein